MKNTLDKLKKYERAVIYNICEELVEQKHMKKRPTRKISIRDKLIDIKVLPKQRQRRRKQKNFIRQRLIDMGVLPGTHVMISNIAPFGDPIEICLRGYELSLRKSEAKQIFVTKED